LSYNCTFKEYVKETNQIIVFNGNKVEVYNQSEVSLFN
jgi:outer membrane lipoprotein-sorting protein